MPLTITEQFVLLAINRDSGMLDSRLSSKLGFYLAASGMLELLLSDTFRLDANDKLTFNPSKPPAGPAYLGWIAGKIAKSRQPASIENIIVSLYSWNSRTLHKRVFESMETRGLLEKKQRKAMLVLHFTFWSMQDDVRQTLLLRLREVLLEDGAAGPELLSLSLLAAHANILQPHFSQDEYARIKQRIAYLETKHALSGVPLWYSKMKRAYTEALSSGLG
ncbi:GPP34 family phosphoprotein [Paenibacillus piri]|nr:GPP34 family phosphoprotein [Paenibacillus piri]